LYAKALRGEIEHFTGVSDPYEAPESPDVIVDTQVESVDESVAAILSAIEQRGWIEQPQLEVVA
jgi:adenylylsulfate kinase-like enzyme